MTQNISSPAADDAELLDSAFSEMVNLDHFDSQFDEPTIALSQWDQQVSGRLPFAESLIQQMPSSNKAGRKVINQEKPLDRLRKAVFRDDSELEEEFKEALKSGRAAITPLLSETAWNQLLGHQQTGILNTFRTGFVAYFR